MQDNSCFCVYISLEGISFLQEITLWEYNMVDCIRFRVWHYLVYSTAMLGLHFLSFFPRQNLIVLLSFFFFFFFFFFWLVTWMSSLNVLTPAVIPVHKESFVANDLIALLCLWFIFLEGCSCKKGSKHLL